MLAQNEAPILKAETYRLDNFTACRTRNPATYTHKISWPVHLRIGHRKYSWRLFGSKPWPRVSIRPIVPHPTNFSTKLCVHQPSLSPSHVLGKKPTRKCFGKVRSFFHSLRLLSAEYRLVLSNSRLLYVNALNYQTLRIQISYVKRQGSSEKFKEPTPILFKTSMKNKTEKV